MEKEYLVVLDGLVLNIVVWDGVNSWYPAQGVCVEQDKVTPYNIGDVYPRISV